MGTRKAKNDRLKAAADSDAKAGAKPVLLKFGLNHVTQLVEDGTAKLVVIAHDVDPIEIMCFLPTLCRKKSVTYCFVRGKAALGRLVHQKTATCVALCGVNRENHLKALDSLKQTADAKLISSPFFPDNGSIVMVQSEAVEDPKAKVEAFVKS